jgi:phosphoribosylformimino-5-aminoimidazole carboxamide ribotide isomerase
MQLYPAIDLLDGKCVRLRRGDPRDVTVYSEQPLQIARQFAAAGARWIHVVDLNGAFTGVQVNLPVIREIAAVSGAQIQMGGGLRTSDALRKAFRYGVARCVAGTAALNPELLRQWGNEFSERLAVGIDTQDGTVRVAGWTEDSGVTVTAFLDALREAALQRVIVTDIARDGMLSGPNLSLLREVVQAEFSVIASGGISSLDDLRLLATELPRLDGIIVGKAIYEGKVSVADAIQVLNAE